MADNVYYCQNCGGVMVFDVKSQSLKCPNCDTSVQIENDKNKIVEHGFSAKKARSIPVSEKKSSTMQCKGCGAVVEVSADCTATECAYCGTKYVLAEKQQEQIIPDGVVPFAVDKHKVKEIFTTWINKRWLAPGKLKNLYESDKIQGVYLPYWTFDADAYADYTAEGGTRHEVKVKKSDGTYETKTEVKWEHTSGRVDKFFDDVLVNASKTMKQSLLSGVEPFDTVNGLSSYSPEYLSGYSAECYSVSLGDAHNTAVNKMSSELTSLATQDVKRRYDEARNVRISAHYKDESYKHVLIPVYSTSYSYNNKNYSVLINGQTGKISGNYPLSPVKIAIIIITVIVIIVGIILASSKGKKSDDNTGNEDVYAIPQYQSEMILDDYETRYETEVIDVDYMETVTVQS